MYFACGSHVSQPNGGTFFNAVKLRPLKRPAHSSLRTAKWNGVAHGIFYGLRLAYGTDDIITREERLRPARSLLLGVTSRKGPLPTLSCCADTAVAQKHPSWLTSASDMSESGQRSIVAVEVFVELVNPRNPERLFDGAQYEGYVIEAIPKDNVRARGLAANLQLPQDRLCPAFQYRGKGFFLGVWTLAAFSLPTTNRSLARLAFP